MNHEQMHRFHDEIRAKYNEARNEADRLKDGGDELAEGIARGRASAYAEAMAAFWKVANEAAQ